MKVTYIGHSGVSVEYEDCVFVFDYYNGSIPEFDKEKKIIFFVSHFHADHFNREIFAQREKYGHIAFILSKDVRRHMSSKVRQALCGKDTFFVNKDQKIFVTVDNLEVYDERKGLDDLCVETLKSTDEGVAFIISYKGRVIYHAGDLHWWTWKGETDREYKEMTEAFQNEIQKLEGRHIDLAFTVLDPRQEERYWMGMDYFLEHVDVDKVFPIHFWNDFDLIRRFKDREGSETYKNKVADIQYNGQNFQIDG